MTNKPPRTRYEKEKERERIRFLRRTQEEREADLRLDEFIRHPDDDDYKDDDVTANKIS